MGSGGDGGGCDPAASDDCGCTAVDILFVIDNSGSMARYQEQLAAAFPGFVESMFTALPDGTDLHVGVTTTSFCDLQTQTNHGEANCLSSATNAEALANYFPPTGGMVGGEGWQGRLVEVDGRRYFEANTGDPSTRQPLEDWFTRAAAVGAEGCQFEFNAAAAGYALHPDNGPTNGGFLRDDGAVLLLFILSDEADQSGETPEGLAGYREMVVDAKARCGGDRCVVTGGLLNWQCVDLGRNTSFDFLASFGEDPIWGNIGSPFGIGPAPDYQAVIGDALAQVIAETCELIPPVG